jgi:hypothetical protein
MTTRACPKFVGVAACSLLVACGSAWAQQGSQPKPGPKTSNPGKPVSPVTPAQPTTPAKTSPADPPPAADQPREEPKIGPYVKQTNGRDLTFSMRLLVNSDNPSQKTTYRDPFSGTTVDMPVITPFEFETLAVIWPILPPTASATPEAFDLKGTLKLNDTVVCDTPTLLKGYPGGVRLSRWDSGKAQSTTCRQVELMLELPMRCYQTDFDEKAALAVPWPTGAWPADAQSVMRPQLYVESGVDGEGHVRMYDDTVVAQTLAAWLEEDGLKDAKSISPVALAKTLTAKVWANIQPSGDGLTFKRTGELSGVMLQPPVWTLEQRRGSEHDMTVALAAVMRKAGLPARTVIGWDVGSGNKKFLSKSQKQNQLRSWVEFCLYDEKANTVNWVPVDIVRLRAMTSKPPPLTRAWQFFGSHNELDSVTPFSMHFHPPTDVVSYGWPGFWGWFVTPQAPKNAEQALSFSATVTAKKPGQGDRKKGSEDEKKPTVKRGY